MIYCKTYDEARLAVIHLLSDDTIQEYSIFEIKYVPGDRICPYHVETKDFTDKELEIMAKLGD